MRKLLHDFKPPRSGEGVWGLVPRRVWDCSHAPAVQDSAWRKSQGALARSRSGRVCRRQRTAPLCEFPGSAAQRSPNKIKILQFQSRMQSILQLKRVRTDIYVLAAEPHQPAAKRRRESEGESPQAGLSTAALTYPHMCEAPQSSVRERSVT